MKLVKSLFGGILVLGLAGSAQATLIDNGDGTFTDTSTGLMWLLDANYAQTSGFNSTGMMDWATAMDWAENLVYAGYDDWRLPMAIDTGSPGCDVAYTGGTDCGYNVDPSTGELVYLIQEVLGNGSLVRTDGSHNPDCSNVFPYCLQNTSADGVNIQNLLQPWYYWYGTEDITTNNANAWIFMGFLGSQYTIPKNAEAGAWVVRSANGGNVPEPGTAMLVGFGLLGLGVRKWRRKVQG